MGTTITLQFEITLEDVIEVHLFHLQRTKKYKRELSIIRLGVTGIAFFFGLIIVILINRAYLELGAALLAIFSSLVYFSVPLYFRGRTRNQLRASFLSGERKASLGGHTLRFDEKGMEEKNGDGKTYIQWTGQEKFFDLKNLILIFSRGDGVHFVPKRSFSSKKAARDFFQWLTDRRNWEDTKFVRKK